MILFIITAILFLWNVVEIIYWRNTKRSLIVFGNVYNKTLTPQQQQIIYANYSFYRRLKPKYKRYFDHRVHKFINRYQFAAHNLEITEEIKIIIASCYVKLTFGTRDFLTNVFHTIIVYPDIYPSTTKESVFHKGEYNPHMAVVKFSWKHFLEGIKIENDNLNLGLHEFTHVLHFESKTKTTLKTVLFKESLQRIMQELGKEVVREKLLQSGYIRAYAFENQFEFVAVLLENFFETPEDFKSQFPNLFVHVSQMINHNESRFLY